MSTEIASIAYGSLRKSGEDHRVQHPDKQYDGCRYGGNAPLDYEVNHRSERHISIAMATVTSSSYSRSL
jgi:hypothetical protein